MMPSCRLASEPRSQIHQVFQVTSHIVGLVVLCAEIPIHLLSTHQTYSILTCTRIPCRGSHCDNGRVVVFTFRVQCVRVCVAEWCGVWCVDVSLAQAESGCAL